MQNVPSISKYKQIQDLHFRTKGLIVQSLLLQKLVEEPVGLFPELLEFPLDGLLPGGAGREDRSSPEDAVFFQFEVGNGVHVRDDEVVDVLDVDVRQKQIRLVQVLVSERG